MSSHREAPEISKDPVADNTDVYGFVSPDNPNTVTLIANYIPLEGPAGGPNFYEFGDDVLYEIHIDNDGDGGQRHHLPIPFSDHSAKSEHLFVQHRTDQLADRSELEQAPVVFGDPDKERPRDRPGRRPALSALQYRPRFHPELRRPRGRQPSTICLAVK